MPAPRTIEITMDGTDQIGAIPLWCWQANKLTIEATLASSATLLDAATTITAEIHSSAAPAGSEPLASSAVAATGDEWTFDFNTLDMSFSIGDDVSGVCYLFVTVQDSSGDELQTLAARRLEVKASGWSGLDPDPPTPAIYATAAPQYVTMAAHAGLPNERVLTAGAGITLTDGGAGSTATVALANSLISIVSDTGVRTNYNPAADTDVARGTALMEATFAAVAGDTIHLGRGTYALENQVCFPLPDNCHMILDPGAKITSEADASSLGPIIVPGNNSVIQGGTVEGVAVATFQVPIGVDVELSAAAKTGIRIIGVKMVGDWDGFYFNGNTDPCTAELWDCRIETKYDAITISSSSGSVAHRIDAYNCRIAVAGPSASGLGVSRGITAQRGGRIRMYGGSIEVTNGGVNVNAGAVTLDSGTVEVHDVSVRVSNGGNPKYDLLNNVGGTLSVSGGSGSDSGNVYLTSGSITRLNDREVIGGLDSVDYDKPAKFDSNGEFNLSNKLRVFNGGGATMRLQVDVTGITASRDQTVTDADGRLSVLRTTPPISTATPGKPGEWAADSSYLYVYSPSYSGWMRAALSAF